MVDFHTHILPGIDDGSRNQEMTEAMISEELQQGVNQIVATPHFYASRKSISSFLQKRDQAYEIIRNLHDQLYLGAEVYYFPGMGRAEQLPELCIRGTQTILIELPFEQWDEQVFQDLQEMIQKKRLTVVLAHVERYPEFQKREDIWNRIFRELPVTAQINTGSFQKKGGLFSRDKKRKFCLQFLKEHPKTTILGSDCHNLTSRPPNLAAGRAVIQKELGEEALKRIDLTTEKVLGIEPIDSASDLC